MKQFKSLLVRDVRLSKWTLILPLIVTIFLYAVIVFVDMKWGINLNSNEFNFENINIPLFGLVAVFLSNLWLYGMLVSLAIVIMSPTSLNDGIRHKCEVFYRCLPIPSWKLVSSKFLVSTMIPWVSSILLSIINILIANAFLGNESEISLWSLIHLTIGISIFTLPFLVVTSSLYMLLSAIIKKKVFIKFFGTIIGLNIFLKIIDLISDVKIETLSEYFSRWLINPSFTGAKLFDSEELARTFLSQTSIDSGVIAVSNNLVANLFSFDGFILFVASFGLLAAATYFHKIRRID